MVDAFHSRRDLVGLLKEIPGIKSMFQKDFLFFGKNIKRNFNKDANDFAMYLLGKLMWRP
jgi:aspartate aminotransferase